MSAQQNIMISGSLGPKVIASDPLSSLFQMTSNEVFSGDPAYMPVTYVNLQLRIGADLQGFTVADDLMKVNLKQFTPDYELEEATLDLSRTYFQEQEDVKKLMEDKVKAKDEEEKKRIEEERERLAKVEAEKRAEKERQREKWEEENREKQAKIAEMIAVCGSHLKDSDARFYLESQNWDMRQAVRFYYEFSGSQVNDKTEIKFMLPEGDGVVIKEFKTKDTLWDVRIVAGSMLSPDRQFEMSISKGEPISPDSYGKTLLELGFVPSVHLHIEYSDTAQ
mmetsp:Transcript_15082/g.16756  ORF Transcript_15082/g.16756 Transcript_15082/m.16756 type:complete len:279 (-) Transcript_15082:137-973(-)|eukprot:CAMPEP_0114991612 /NCGR_PEP_ID=MMETSP0216-20121206/11471_1 /TAXON_ID=223996 /ORGANISM="Protocruzia adherens, Strain Boccale" /LENGTH=278 /DNA_ID=CAMNT_0002354963 /DNA_START=205 /DNA_END=1041 /DNA_ORIENTATION=-